MQTTTNNQPHHNVSLIRPVIITVTAVDADTMVADCSVVDLVSQLFVELRAIEHHHRGDKLSGFPYTQTMQIHL